MFKSRTCVEATWEDAGAGAGVVAGVSGGQIMLTREWLRVSGGQVAGGQRGSSGWGSAGVKWLEVSGGQIMLSFKWLGASGSQIMLSFKWLGVSGGQVAGGQRG